MTNIYGLYDPRDRQQIIWYVGKGLSKRAEHHWRYFLRTGKAVNALLRRWFEKLKADNIAPSWKFLEENVTNWEESEKTWVGLWRVCNLELCNVADGGNSPVLPPEIRAEISRKVGLENVRSGRLAYARSCNCYDSLSRHEDSSRSGKKGIKGLHKKYSLEIRKQWSALAGRKNAEKPGFLRKIRLIGLHNRWHKNRGLKKDDCEFCREEAA